MRLCRNCVAKKDCIKNVGLFKLIGILMQKYVFIIVALNFPTWAECSSQEPGTEPMEKQASFNLADALEAQNRLIKLSKTQKRFFEFILKEPENFTKYNGFVDNIKEIAESTPQNDKPNSFLSNILKSFYNSEESQLISKHANATEKNFEAYTKYFRLYWQHKNNFLLIIKLMIMDLYKDYKPDAKACEEISKLFDISGIEPQNFQGIDRKSLLDKIMKEKEKNLTNIYILVNYKSSLTKAIPDDDPQLRKKDIGFLNYIIRESIFLNMKFESATFETLGTKEMVKAYISNAIEDYNLVCTYFLRFLYASKAFYDKEQNQYITCESQEFLPVKDLFYFLPDGEKMSKYLYSEDSLGFKSFIKYCIGDGCFSLTRDIRLLTYFKGRDASLENKFKDFYGKLNVLKLRIEDLAFSSINCGIIKSRSIESLDRLKQNLFAKLELETDNLAKNLLPETFLQMEFLGSLRKFFLENSPKYLPGVEFSLQTRRFNEAAHLLLIEFPAKAPNKLYYETLIIFLKFRFTFNLPLRLSIPVLTGPLINEIKNFSIQILADFPYKKASYSKDLKIFFDEFFKFFDVPSNKEFSITRIFAIENLIKDIENLRDTEKKKQSEYLEIVKRFRGILPQIFIFTSKEEIDAISHSDPYEERISHYENFISGLKGLLSSSGQRKEIVFESGPSTTDKPFETKRPPTADTSTTDTSTAKRTRTE